MALDPALQHLVTRACSTELPWRGERDAFTPRDLLVLEYAESVTATPPSVAGGLTEELLGWISHAELIELTASIAATYLQARMNAVLGRRNMACCAVA